MDHPTVDEMKFPRRRVLLYWLLLLLLSCLATWALVFVHEGLGHCLIGRLAGAEPYGFHVGLGFYGYAVVPTPSPDFGEPPPLQYALVMLGGIIANIASGALVGEWLARLLKRGSKRRVFLLFLALFSLYSVVGQTIYAFSGIVYQFGDVPFFHHDETIPSAYLWIPFLVIIPFASYFFVGLYVKVQNLFFPIQSPPRRLKFSLMTLGSIVGLFLLLLAIGFAPVINIMLRSSHVGRHEIKFLPAALFAYLLLSGALAAAWRTSGGSDLDYRPLKWRSAAVPTGAVALAALFLAVTGGSFQWPSSRGLPRYPGRLAVQRIEVDPPYHRFELDEEGLFYFFDGQDLCRFDPQVGEKVVVASNLEVWRRTIDKRRDRIYFTRRRDSSNPEETVLDLVSFNLTTKQSFPLRTVVVKEENYDWLWEMQFLVSADEDRVLATDGRAIKVVNVESGNLEPFCELPREIPGAIVCAEEGPGGAIYVAAGQEDMIERNVLLRYSHDGSSFAVVAEGLPSIQRMKFDSNGDLYCSADGRSALILVREDSAVGQGAAWELIAGWDCRIYRFSTPNNGSLYYWGGNRLDEGLYRLTVGPPSPN